MDVVRGRFCAQIRTFVTKKLSEMGWFSQVFGGKEDFGRFRKILESAPLRLLKPG